jgi:hypothetical protein
MEKRGEIYYSAAALFIILLLFSMPLVSAQAYSGFSKFTDNIRLFFSSGDNKVRLALEIREKEVNSAIDNAKSGNNERVADNLESASDKLKIVQEKTSIDIAEEVKENINNVKNNLKENTELSDSSRYFEDYLNEEQKTLLSVELSEKVFNYCNELAMQDYELMSKDEKCLAYSWMENKVGERVEEKRGEDFEEIKNQIAVCMSSPKECNCGEVSIASEKANCEKLKASAIRCEFQNDGTACREIETIRVEESERERYEKEIIEKYVPGECSEAGVRDGEECKKLIIALNKPESECMENGQILKGEECEKKLVKEDKIPDECIRNGGLVSEEECLSIIKEISKPDSEEFNLMSGECKERGVYDPVACDEIVNLPRPCKDAGFYTKKECESFTLNQNLPKECIDAGALTPEACEMLKLPQKCQGEAFSKEECDAVFIKEKMPPECQESETYDFHECAKLLYEKVSSASIESETDWLNSKGISTDEIPDECFEGNNFVRDMECDQALIKEFGVMLPPPVETSGIPQKCMRNGTPVSPEECEEILQGGVMADATPEICKKAEVSTPEECAKLLEEQRQKEGIGINMPEECIGISTEECKTLMEEKGIPIKKVEQMQRVEKVEKAEKVQRMCKEGEVCEEEQAEYTTVELPKECIKTGVSDIEQCKMIMSKINEERIKQGSEITVDKEGKVDYIQNEEIDKLVGEAEKRSEEIKPDTEKAEEIKEEIKDIEENIQQIGQGAGASEEIQREQPGPGPEVQSPGSGQQGPEVQVQENTGGEQNAPVTGGTVNSGNRIGSFIEKILRLFSR